MTRGSQQTGSGKIYLVGAGPGDPGLFTVRAMELIRRADVIVYDRLVNDSILSEARPDCELIYVGKESSQHTLPQDDINALLADKALTGKMVVRLKGGDPFVFGRGGEEAMYAREKGIEFEIVPGVTSAIAAPAYAGIPVTHREYTSTLAIITGHEKPGKEFSSIAWDKIATGAGTIVFLMGLENLGSIAENLINNGRPAQTPVALIQWGTTLQQRVVTGTLQDIAERASRAGMRPPVVIVVGEVVELRERLAWFDKRPLFGKRIVVTRARQQASQLVSRLMELGAEVLEYPTIAVQSIPRPDLAKALEQNWDWVIFTSVNGVDEFFRQIYNLGCDIRDVKGRVCAIGPATAKRLEERGIRVEAVPDEYRAEAAAEMLLGMMDTGQRALLPRAKGARPVLPDMLRNRGIVVEEIEIYEAVPDGRTPPGIRQYVENGDFDLITFTSSSTVTNFIKVIGLQNFEKIKGSIRAACIGPVTAETARNEGIRVELVAREYTIDGLVAAIVGYFSEPENEID